MIFFSNAKINIGLNIINKRADGYHNIESIFYPVKWCDVIEILPAKRFELINYGNKINCNIETNLCYKAFKLIKEHYSIPDIKIILYKNIPTESGLGGGSSNASTVLKGLNKFFKLNITKKELLMFAQKIGSDCSFFIINKPSFIKGKGDILEPANINLSQYYCVIIKENVSISTKWAYSLINEYEHQNIKAIIENYPVSEWKYHLKNDFEKYILKHFPILLEIKNWLYQNNALYASLTGSGSAIYGIFKDKPNLQLNKYQFFWTGKLTLNFLDDTQL
jgi:4-diphosphocytidyl-2-C-methyl-D-erythritol kinase